MQKVQKKNMSPCPEPDGWPHVDGMTGRHSPLPPCSAGQTVVVSRNADRDFFYGEECAVQHRNRWFGAQRHSPADGAAGEPSETEILQPDQAITGGRCPRVALRWKNSAWLTTAETVAGWNGFAIRKAGSGRWPVRKRSG